MVALLKASGLAGACLSASPSQPQRPGQRADQHPFHSERNQRCGFHAESREGAHWVKEIIVNYDYGQAGGKKTWPQATVPGADHHGSAQHCGAEHQQENTVLNEQRIHQQLDPERHGDTRYSDTVAQQPRWVTYRVPFVVCSDTHNLWSLSQERGSRSAEGQLVLHSTSSSGTVFRSNVDPRGRSAHRPNE